MFVAVILTARLQVAVSTQALGNTIRVFKFYNQKLTSDPHNGSSVYYHTPKSISVLCWRHTYITYIRHLPTLLTKCYKRHTDPMLYVV